VWGPTLAKRQCVNEYGVTHAKLYKCFIIWCLACVTLEIPNLLRDRVKLSMEGVRKRFAKTMAKPGGEKSINIWCLEEITPVLNVISLDGLKIGGGWIKLKHDSDDVTIIRLRKEMGIPDGVGSGVIFLDKQPYKMYKENNKSADVRKGKPTNCSTGDKVGMTEKRSMKITFTARLGEIHSLGQVYWGELKYSRNFLVLKFGRWAAPIMDWGLNWCFKDDHFLGGIIHGYRSTVFVLLNILIGGKVDLQPLQK